MPITAGSICVSRRINTGDYTWKDARAEVHWTSEGDPQGVQASAGEAQDLALSMIATTLATVVKLNGTPELELGADNGRHGVPEGHVVRDGVLYEIEASKTGPDMSDESETGRCIANAAPKRHRRTKAEMEAAKAAVPETAMPLTPLEQAIMEKVAEEMALVTEPQTEIRDKELNHACEETWNRTKNKPAIQGVIRLYTDGNVSTIPQENRTEFLSKLKAL